MRIDHTQTLSNLELRVPHRQITLRTLAERLLAPVLMKLQIRRERIELAGLPAHLLQDVGITPCQARAESLRTFNDIPDARRPRLTRDVTPGS